VPPVEEPLSRADLVLLRRLVLEHKAAERRHRFPAVLHLGGPGRPEAGRIVEDHAGPDPERLDHALRCDVLEALLKRATRTDPGRPLMTWLTRPGTLEVQDLDLEWLRAVTRVNAETDRALPFLVVTRDGWRDPASGVERRWRRLRQR
jgi:hypothetical protein